MSVVSYIKKEGGTKSWSLTKLTRDLLAFCDLYEISLLPVHIAGFKNVHADALSRAGIAQAAEWAVSREEISRIFSLTGKPVLDLMATEHNCVVPAFVSPVPCQGAWAVDVFSISLPTDGLLYAFPPPVLVPRLLEFIQRTPQVYVLLLASMSPDRVFYPDLLGLAVRDPLPVCRQRFTLWQQVPGLQQTQWHSNPELFQLGAWLLLTGQ